ncbi:MAG: non-homologous end-joining DNA ligase [Clostridia bacterium]|nr:non-homologous end-joining DNA ligase [Clostridia bacterium]
MNLEIIKPMLSITCEPFDHPGFIFEVKWDGYRCLAYLNNRSRLYSRNGYEMTERYPELADLYRAIKGGPLVLDGELVTFYQGRPSFQHMQRRDRLRDPKRVKWMATHEPVVFVAFDLLAHEGRWITQQPLAKRKELLAEVAGCHPQLIISQYIHEDGQEFYRACLEQQLEGVMAKKWDSPYLPGKRTPYWRKIKTLREEDFVVCGYVPGAGHRQQFGSLILGAYQGDKLVYQGQVGTGFSEEFIQELLALLETIRIPDSPFSHRIVGLVRPRWVEPRLVCTVQFLERTMDCNLRHASFKGFRPDKEPRECRGPEVD